MYATSYNEDTSQFEVKVTVRRCKLDPMALKAPLVSFNSSNIINTKSLFQLEPGGSFPSLRRYCTGELVLPIPCWSGVAEGWARAVDNGTNSSLYYTLAGELSVVKAGSRCKRDPELKALEILKG